MPAKPFKWAIKTPLASLKCPHCGQALSVAITMNVNTRPKTWKIVKGAVKEGKGDGPDE